MTGALGTVLLLAAGHGGSVSAGERTLRDDLQAASPVANARTITGKERLGRKWTDEQRVDDCNVPPDKRGSKPRPATCARDQHE